MTKTEPKTEQKTFKFLLLRGGHSTGSFRDGTRKQYERGDVVETTVDLAKKFGRNKFHLLREKGEVT